MENTKQARVLEIFFRGLRGEDLSVQKLADEYEVSTKSVTRSINDLKAFLADHRDLVGNTELQYSHQDKCYRLHEDGGYVLYATSDTTTEEVRKAFDPNGCVPETVVRIDSYPVYVYTVFILSSDYGVVLVIPASAMPSELLNQI